MTSSTTSSSRASEMSCSSLTASAYPSRRLDIRGSAARVPLAHRHRGDRARLSVRGVVGEVQLLAVVGRMAITERGHLPFATLARLVGAEPVVDDGVDDVEGDD